MTPAWPHRGAPGIRGRGRANAIRNHDPASAWRALIGQVRACAGGELLGPGPWEQLARDRAAAMGAPFPVEGEPAKAASMALLEMVRAWPRCGEEQRGWHGDSVLALARQCEVLIDQQAHAAMRRMSGERD